MDTHSFRPIRSLVPTSPLRTATPSLRSQFFTHIQHSFTNYFQLDFSEFSDPFSIFAINLSIYHSLWRVYTEKYRNSGQKMPLKPCATRVSGSGRLFTKKVTKTHQRPKVANIFSRPLNIFLSCREQNYGFRSILLKPLKIGDFVYPAPFFKRVISIANDHFRRSVFGNIG